MRQTRWRFEQRETRWGWRGARCRHCALSHWSRPSALRTVRIGTVRVSVSRGACQGLLPCLCSSRRHVCSPTTPGAPGCGSVPHRANHRTRFLCPISRPAHTYVWGCSAAAALELSSQPRFVGARAAVTQDVRAQHRAQHCCVAHMHVCAHRAAWAKPVSHANKLWVDWALLHEYRRGGGPGRVPR